MLCRWTSLGFRPRSAPVLAPPNLQTKMLVRLIFIHIYFAYIYANDLVRYRVGYTKIHYFWHTHIDPVTINQHTFMLPNPVAIHILRKRRQINRKSGYIHLTLRPSVRPSVSLSLPLSLSLSLSVCLSVCLSVFFDYAFGLVPCLK